MKITDPGIIKSGENELIDAITADMDWGGIGKIFGEKHNLEIDDEVEYKNGDIIVHNNQIAYQLNFDVKVSLSIVLDREGNYLSLLTSLDRNVTRKESDTASSEEGLITNESEGEKPSGTGQSVSGNDEATREAIASETAPSEDEPQRQEATA